VSSSFKYIVRMFGTDVDGNKPIMLGLTSIKGIGFHMAFSIARSLGLDLSRKMGDLSDEEVSRLTKALEDPVSFGVPHWMVNRQKDFETGKDLHLNTSDLIMAVRDDITRMKKIRCYKGVRHERGLKVRGQRTRSTGRKGLVVGVKKKKGGGLLREAPAEKGQKAKEAPSEKGKEKASE